MNKKILKRSVMLGALMAFVITGSAWAETITFESNRIDSTGYVAGAQLVVDMNGHNWTINNDNGNGLTLKGFKIIGENNDLSITATSGGISNKGSIDGGNLINVNKLTVTADSDKNALSSYGSLTVKAKEIELEGGNGIYANETKNKYVWDITSDNLIVTAEKDGIKAQYGTEVNVTVNKELAITAKNEGRAAIVALTNLKDGTPVVDDDGNFYTSEVNVVAKEKATITGDIRTREGSKVYVEMNSPDSVFTGAVIGRYKDTETLTNPDVSLTLNKGATWKVTGDSTVATLAGENARIEKDESVTGDVTVTVNNTSKYHYNNCVLKDTKVTLSGVDLVVNSSVSQDKRILMGMLSNSHIISDGNVTIQQTGENDVALGYYSDDSIKAKSIKISSEDYAVYASNGLDRHVLEAIGEIEINSKARSVFNGDGVIDIKAEKVTITSDRSGEGKANNAITVNGTGTTEIKADKVTLVGGIDLINSDATVNFKSTDGTTDVKVMQITGDINAKVGTLSGMTLNGINSFITGSINTENNEKAVISLNNGATWNVTGKSSVSTLAGNEGTINVEKAEANLVTIANQSNENLTLNVASGGNLGVDVKEGVKEFYSTVVDANGDSLIKNLEIGAVDLQADVSVDGDIVTTTIKPGDTFVIESNVEVTGDVVVSDGNGGTVSLRDTATKVNSSAQAILGLDSRVASTEESINNINTSIDGLDNRVASNTESIAKEVKAREDGDAANAKAIEELRTTSSDNSNAISGINQRLGKMNGKINKVGAGAAALAALHPLEYDPDDKLTFSAGVGNYAGENAAALGAFYRPDEKLMFSLGGTMGNGENMVNLGVSIGLDKPNGYAKLSKRELIQKVNAMEAKYEAVEEENESIKAEVAELKALVAELLAKK